ncbi:15577_t:CDS:2 [Funneliformis geosporum]|nr:15577_t:CDS:2 [Funneliformis geosporum]
MTKELYINSGNILIHQGVIKLADFGLLKRIEAVSNHDVYSIGVLLWEISSGRPPFYVEGEPYDLDLAIEISQGVREIIIPGTPKVYVKIYTASLTIVRL